MTHKQAKRLFGYYFDTIAETSPHLYIIHLIDENGEISIITDIFYEDDGYYCVLNNSSKSDRTALELIDESQIFVFKQINWNK